MRAMFYRIAVPAVSYDDVGEMRSVPEIFFGMTRLATLLPSLGPAKLLRHSWTYVGKQFSPS
jgi:hypothetical protein